MEPECLNSTQLQVGARAEGVRANATVHFSQIITFRETKGAAGRVGIRTGRDGGPLTDSGALHQWSQVLQRAGFSPLQLSRALTPNTTA